MFLAVKLDEVIASVPWLTEGRVAAALGALATLCLIKDIRIVKQSLTPVKMAVGGNAIGFDEKENANIAMRSDTKSNPQSVFNITNMLEKQWGRKPSYEEVMDFIDHLAIPEDNDLS